MPGLGGWRLIEPLRGEEAAAFARDVAETNRKRLRVLAPLMVSLHIVHLGIFYTPKTLRFSLEPDVLRWRDGLIVAHGVMVPIVLAMMFLVYRAQNPRVVGLIAPILSIAYMIHGGIVTGLDQILLSNITTYIGFCFGIAMVFVLTPRVSLLAYLAGITALVAGMLLLQRSTGARMQNLPAASTMTIISIVFSWLMYAARQKDFLQRRTIDRQRAELATLNAGLEQRVEEQVGEIVARAAEIERLNAQLQAQVRARSGELALALARLARQGQDGGLLARGTILGDRYLIEDAIGEGGMGAVYAGMDQSTGTRVAIKVIQATSSGQLEAMRRFIQEAGATATINHPAVVRMLHVDVSDDGLLFQVQELIDGKTLTLKLGKPWAPADAARLGSVLCEALAAAHAQGVVHRDVKPDNIMLTAAAPGMKLLDFGIAKLYDAVSKGGDETRTGIVLGTPSYMAPEQVGGGGEISDRTDVYSVGVVFYRLLTARFPFDADTPREMMMRHLHARPAGLPDAPAPLAKMVERCLSKQLQARPSAAELARELRGFADQHGARSLEAIVKDTLTQESVADPTMTTRAERGLAD
jgi:protein kinase-like protein